MALLKDHLDFLDEVKNNVITKKLCELMNFTNFHLCKLMNSGLFVPILQSNNDIIIKHVIDNAASVTAIDAKGISLIHYLCSLTQSITLLDYVIEKYKIDLETETPNKSRPIFYACELGSFEKIKFLVNKKVDLGTRDVRNYMPIHYACSRQPFEVIHFLLDLSINLMDNDAIWLLIHLVCKYRDSKIIKEILPYIKSLLPSISLHNNGTMCNKIDDAIGNNHHVFMEDIADLNKFIITNC